MKFVTLRVFDKEGKSHEQAFHVDYIQSVIPHEELDDYCYVLLRGTVKRICVSWSYKYLIEKLNDF